MNTWILIHVVICYHMYVYIQGITDYGYALCDICTELSNCVLRTEYPDPVSAHLLDKLSTIEYRLSHGANEKLQLGSLVGAFIVGRDMMSRPKGTA